MAGPFVADNDTSRRRLEVLVGKLASEDLGRTTDYGWTVAALLAHLAWWDQRVLVLLRRWRERGYDDSPVDSELINDALKPLCHAIEPRAAIQLCLSAAAQTDAEVAGVPEALVREIEAGPVHFRLNRSLHRNSHLDDIEALLRDRAAG